LFAIDFYGDCEIEIYFQLSTGRYSVLLETFVEEGAFSPMYVFDVFENQIAVSAWVYLLCFP
jgi:hypothetical protein